MVFVPITSATHDTIAQALRRGIPMPTIAQSTCVSLKTVRRASTNAHHFGTTRPYRGTGGRRRTLSLTQEKWICEVMIAKPDLEATEVIWEFFDEYEYVISRKIVYSTLARYGFTKKVIRRDAAERSQLLRDTWRGTMALYRPDQLVFVDESAANEKTGWRKYGWSQRGSEAVTQGSLRRSERYSILPALTINGYTTGTLIIQGSVTQAIFNDWIQDEVLPRCNPFPQPRSVIVLDNCVVHRHADVLAMCEEAGVHIQFLPPYSPDYNPIELTFNVLKQWIKSNNFLIHTFPGDFGAFLQHATEASGCDAHALRMFEKCGYTYSVLNT